MAQFGVENAKRCLKLQNHDVDAPVSSCEVIKTIGSKPFFMQSQRIVDFDCFFCDICRRYVYDEASGDQSICVPPFTTVDMLPQTWRCPVCGANKDELRASTLSDHFTHREYCQNLAAAAAADDVRHSESREKLSFNE